MCSGILNSILYYILFCREKLGIILKRTEGLIYFYVENLSSYSQKDSRFTLLYVENALKMLKELYVEKGIVVRNLPSNSKKDCV